MSAVTASLAPRSTARRTLPRDVRPVRLPSGYTVPRSVLPSRSTFVRRRVGAVVFLVALVLSVGSVAQRGLADRGDQPASVTAVGRTTYVVQPGDTLWRIAERFYGGADLGQVVDAMVTLNGGATIQAGQTLDLP
jgi:nucleoid-associated protein YgaU